MSRLVLILCCLLLNVSLVLAPFSTLHMHVGVDQHVQLHGGHVHLNTHDDGDDHEAAHAVDLHIVTSDGSFLHKQAWLLEGWISCVLAIVFLFLPVVRLPLGPMV